ncbi:hypothetical protein VKT23_013866 [Stygiomarasmius scandens]|uniref:Uncharacterized protein n=1 Tax=Marasmiellus scandens TaxID=2682957 RepID=A0ABR1J201_9AGAR
MSPNVSSPLIPLSNPPVICRTVSTSQFHPPINQSDIPLDNVNCPTYPQHFGTKRYPCPTVETVTDSSINSPAYFTPATGIGLASLQLNGPLDTMPATSYTGYQMTQPLSPLPTLWMTFLSVLPVPPHPLLPTPGLGQHNIPQAHADPLFLASQTIQGSKLDVQIMGAVMTPNIYTPSVFLTPHTPAISLPVSMQHQSSPNTSPSGYSLSEPSQLSLKSTQEKVKLMEPLKGNENYVTCIHQAVVSLHLSGHICGYPTPGEPISIFNYPQFPPMDLMSDKFKHWLENDNVVTSLITM